MLNIVDDITRECLAAIPDTLISRHRVARELVMLIERRDKPGMIVSDNRTELRSNAILAWSKDHKVDWHHPESSMQLIGRNDAGDCTHYRANDDLADTGWVLMALEERAAERHLREWPKLKLIADEASTVLLNRLRQLH